MNGLLSAAMLVNALSVIIQDRSVIRNTSYERKTKNKKTEAPNSTNPTSIYC